MAVRGLAIARAALLISLALYDMYGKPLFEFFHVEASGHVMPSRGLPSPIAKNQAIQRPPPAAVSKQGVEEREDHHEDKSN